MVRDMKIDDDKRREVAKRMREIMRKNPHAWLDVMVANAVHDVIGDGVVIGETVADLIDRPTTSIIANRHGRACCANCGCDDWCLAPDGEARFCPSCGAEIIEKDDE